MSLARPLEPSGRAWKGLLLLALVYLFATSWNLSLQTVANPDEPRYACPAREMAEGQRDWIVPYFNGAPRLQKPILLYWLLALAGIAGRALGVGLGTAFRWVPVLSSLLTVLALHGLGRRLFNRRVGFLAGLILASVYYFHEVSREIVIDPLLTALLTCAWYFFVAALERLEHDPARTPARPLVGFYLCLGLACLAKGPFLVAIFCVLPMSAYLLWERKRYLPEIGLGRWLIARTGLCWGLPLALGVGGSWFVLLWINGEREAVKAFLYQQNIQRAMGHLDHNSGDRLYPLVYYLHDLPGHFLPWALLGLPALFWAAKEWIGKKGKARGAWTPPAKLLLCASAIPFLIMGSVGSKRSLYLLPIYPFLALWIAWAWERTYLNRADVPGAPKAGDAVPQDGLARLWPVLLGALGVLAALGSAALAGLAWWGAFPELLFTRTEQILALVLAVALAAGAGWGMHDLRRGRRWRASLHVLAVWLALAVVSEAVLRPARERGKDRRGFYAQLAEAAEGRPLLWLGGSANEAPWYLKRTVPRILGLAPLREKFFAVPRALLLVREKEYNRKRFEKLRVSVRELKRIPYGGRAYRLVEADPERPPEPALFQRPRGKK